MSQFYEMSVEISEYDPEKELQIKAAAEEEWSFGDWWAADRADGKLVDALAGEIDDDIGKVLHASAQGSLCGGESEEEFTERLSLAVWRANGRYCCVVVDATYLESLPYETHSLDADDYDRLLKRKENTDARDQSVGDASG
jgi:hypothetical protein